MKLIYEDLALMFPLGYIVKLDNIPAQGDVVVLTETPSLSYTDELIEEERALMVTSEILVYVRVKDDIADNEKIISDLIKFFMTVSTKIGEKIGVYWIQSVENTGGPTYLGRQQDNALFSMNFRIIYKLYGLNTNKF